MFLQPQRRLEVEVIGRLVEQQQVGRGEQRGRERDPHAPAAGEFAARALLLGMGKAQAGEDFGRARRRRMCADVREPRLDLGDARGIMLGLGCGQQLRAFCVGGEHDLEQAFGAIGRFLRKSSDAASRREPYLALLGREFTGDDAKQRGLAGAVAAHEADPGTGRQCDRGVLEQPAAADPVGDVAEPEHGGVVKQRIANGE